MEEIRFGVFADGSFGIRSAGRRLEKQARQSGLFSLGTVILNLHSLVEHDANFMVRNSMLIDRFQKGLGNYIWKPQALIQLLNEVEEGQFVCLIDAGCQLNLTPSAVSRFQEYIKLTENKHGLFMQIKENSFGFSDVTEKAWTKRETLDFLDPKGQWHSTRQIQSGIIFMKKSEVSTTFARKWLETCEYKNSQLLFASIDSSKEYPSNLGHRWEQSIMSILVKEFGFQYIDDETYWFPNWQDGLSFPIWAMRNRSGGDAFRRNFLDLIQIAAAKLF
jgi:hypothetical protein